MKRKVAPYALPEALPRGAGWLALAGVLGVAGLAALMRVLGLTDPGPYVRMLVSAAWFAAPRLLIETFRAVGLVQWEGDGRPAPALIVEPAQAPLRRLDLRRLLSVEPTALLLGHVFLGGALAVWLWFGNWRGAFVLAIPVIALLSGGLRVTPRAQGGAFLLCLAVVVELSVGVRVPALIIGVVGLVLLIPAISLPTRWFAGDGASTVKR